MVIYLAVSADTTTGKSAYAYRINSSPVVSRVERNSTGPRELLRGLIGIFDDILKEGMDKKNNDFIIITNNQFITKMINENQIEQWHDCNWIKSTGDPVASVDLLKQIYNYVLYFKEQKKNLFLTKPESSVEEANFKSVSKIALNKRKYS